MFWQPALAELLHTLWVTRKRNLWSGLKEEVNLGSCIHWRDMRERSGQTQVQLKCPPKATRPSALESGGEHSTVKRASSCSGLTLNIPSEWPGGEEEGDVSGQLEYSANSYIFLRYKTHNNLFTAHLFTPTAWRKLPGWFTRETILTDPLLIDGIVPGWSPAKLVHSNHNVRGTDVSMNDPLIVQILCGWERLSDRSCAKERTLPPMIISYMIWVRCLESLNIFSGT